MSLKKLLVLFPTLALVFVCFISGAGGLVKAVALTIDRHSLPVRDKLGELILPGIAKGISSHFEIKDSEYLNISLDSSETIKAKIESVPKMILMMVEAGSDITSTDLTINNLTPLTTYYKYEDSHHNLTVFKSDVNGSYSYHQDLTSRHIVFIKVRPSTKYIRNNSTGGDCLSIGIWNATTKTCVLVSDVHETIQIDSDGITLDGGGHLVIGPGSDGGFGVFANTHSNVSVKNLNVSNFTYGISFFNSPSNNNSLTNNISHDNSSVGIYILYGQNTTLTNNIANNNQYGFVIQTDGNITLSSNTASNNEFGFLVLTTAIGTISGNTASNNSLVGMFIGPEGSPTGYTLTANNFNNNLYNFYMLDFFGSNTIDTTNLVDGKSIYYLKNISNQTFDATSNAGLFYCFSCSNVTVKDISIQKEVVGIMLSNVTNSTIQNVNSSQNILGIVVDKSSGNTFTNNAFSNNSGNIFAWTTESDSDFDNSIDTTNTVNSKPIYYIKNASDRIFDETTNAGLFYCVNCVRVSIKNLDLQGDNYPSLYIWKGHHVSVDGVSAPGGITSYQSDNNLFVNNNSSIAISSSSNNIIDSNTLDVVCCGINVSGGDSNIIRNNNISYANLDDQTNDLFYNNTVTDGSVRIRQSTNNKIYNNNFVNSPVSQDSVLSGNVFHLPLPKGGNYWSNFDSHTEGCDDTNNDSICDSAYSSYNLTDNYPWKIQNGWPLGASPSISSLSQVNFDLSSIAEGTMASRSTVSIRATLTDPDNDQARLEVELKKFDSSFDGTKVSSSIMVDSGSEATVEIENLIAGNYHWRVRAVDSNGNASAWQEFGTAGNIDFKIHNPVLIIPGMLGSWWKEWVPNLNQADFVMDPIQHTYDALTNAFVDLGYVLDQDIFTFPYDWRLDNRQTAVKLEDKIAAVKAICKCDKVDVVAHSMGGIVSRYYIESNLYQNDIDHLILLGAPNSGGPKAYLMWEGGELIPKIFGDVVDFFAEKLISLVAYAEGYDLNRFEYIHNKPIPSVKQLLPAYNYLKDATTNTLLSYPTGYPENPFLSNSDSLAGLNSPSGLQKLENSGVTITNIVGNDTSTDTISTIRIVQDSSKAPLWADGYPEGYDSLFGDHGLEMGSGDGTVPFSSAASLNTSNTTQIVLNSKHGDLPTKSWPDVSEILTGIRSEAIGTNPLPTKILFVPVFSPVDIQLIDPSGRRIGRDFTNNIDLNEIPGAYYTGNQNEHMEFVAIPNPLDGDYQILTKGTDQGSYKVEADYISDTNSKDTTFTANTATNVDEPLSFNLDTASPAENLAITPQDQTAPVTNLSISDPVSNGWYGSNARITLSATDNTGGVGVFKTEYSLDNGVNWITYTSPFIPPEGSAVVIKYRSEDYVGNIEAVKTSPAFKIDRTPPEAKISFDPETRYIKVQGTDNLSIPAVTKVNSNNYTITDEAGHIIKINILPTYLPPYVTAENVLTVSGASLNATLVSLQYDSNPPILATANLHYEWTNTLLKSNSILKTLVQSITIPGQIIINSTYDSLTNKTTISKQEKITFINWFVNGIDIFKLVTKSGKLNIEY